MAKPVQLVVEIWNDSHDATQFASGVSAIDKYIKEQAAREVRNKISGIFVLTVRDEKIVRGYYSLSAQSIEFEDLPKNLQSKLPKYPRMPATLLGRLGVDAKFKQYLEEVEEEPPHLGEFLLNEAQITTMDSAGRVGSALMLIDVLEPTTEDKAKGARDPMGFYTKYGFQALPNTPRTLYKSIRTIFQEQEAAKETINQSLKLKP